MEWKGLPKLGQGPSDFKSLDEVSSQAVGMGEWARKDSPSLEESSVDDVFEVDIPGYETRRLFLAEDALATANA